MNTPLRASQRKAQRHRKLRWQSRFRSSVLLFIIITTWIVDSFLLHSADLLITKSVAVGSVLNWFAQSLFAWFVFRYTGPSARRMIVGNMYLGQLIKWIVLILGFSFIFMMIKPLSAGAVIFGFIALQIGHFIGLLQIR